MYTSDDIEYGEWEKFNKNPKLRKYTRGKKKGQTVTKSDCVVRAFMQAWGVDWMTAAKRLFARALELADMPNQHTCYETFLKASKINVFVNTPSGRRRYMTVAEFAGTTKHSYQGYIVRCPHHLVFVKHGKYFDAWDSGSLTCRKIWVTK